ncbi:MAG: hypothetical protein HQK50_15100 [Oligoflexia bacterium]|nr:hypothetical protein [Oligoflexia bacterium]MBF0366900.1 hypothetical protein [Oligoflexia bacterium]
MFGIGFLEFIVLALIALVVLGPEEMVKALANMGRWLGKLKRAKHDVVSTLSRSIYKHKE